MSWEAAEAALKHDKYIGPLIKKYGHCEIKPRPQRDIFENLCSAIIGQQLSGKVADVIFARFVKAIGKVSPENVLKVPDQKLRDCGMSWSKVSFIKDLAERIKDGRLETKKLSKLTDEEIEKELVAVKGIGPWTANMFLMFTLGRADIFPSGDLGIKNGIKKITGKEMKPNEMVEFAEAWKPYRTVASWYIWRNLDNK